MDNHNKITNWTIIANLLIVIGAGHGIGVLGLVEVFLLKEIIEEGITFSFHATYDKRLGATIMFSLIGQLICVGSYFIRRVVLRIAFKLLGIGFLWIGFFFLVYDFTTDKAAKLGLITGIPFLILSVLLLVFHLKNFVSWQIEKVVNIEATNK